MGEAEVRNVGDLLKQIDEFEQTIKGLESNVATLKQRLAENREKYGDEIKNWPQDAK